MAGLVEKLSDLSDEFEDEELSAIMDDVTDELSDIINGDRGTVYELHQWLENYEEYNNNDE